MSSQSLSSSKRTAPTHERGQSPPETVVQPSSKRRKTSRPKGTAKTSAPKNKRKGKLSLLLDMPFDILCEIFSKLKPEDLLSLSRTTKTFREVLMRKVNRFVWRAAFAGDPLCPGPTDLNEPQYANLVFSRHCHFCLESGEGQLMWAFRVRCCESCLRRRFVDMHSAFNGRNGPILAHPDLLLSATVIGPKKRKVIVYKHEEVREINAVLVSLQNDEHKLQEFIRLRKEIVKELRSGEAQFEQALALRKQLDAQEKRDAHHKRRELIFSRLRGLGYAEELAYLAANDSTLMDEHPSVKSTKDLTERIWNNMKPKLIELLEDVRVKRLHKQSKSCLKKRQKLLGQWIKNYTVNRPTKEIRPGAADICSMPQIKRILEVPAEVEVTEAHFKEAVPDLSKLFSDWVNSKSQELLNLLPNHVRDNSQTGTSSRTPDFSALELATTFFICLNCPEPISYPRILVHSCLTDLPHGFRNREDNDALMFINVDCLPWNYIRQVIGYHEEASRAAEEVIQTMGLDPRTVKPLEVDDSDRWLECRTCRSVTSGRMVFRWRKAILHQLYHQKADDRCHWILLNDDDVKAAKACESKGYPEHREEKLGYCCGQCHEGFSFTGLRSHVLFEHRIQEFTEAAYYLHPDASMDYPPFSIQIPMSKSTPDSFDLTQESGIERRSATVVGREVIVIDD